ncbi:endonuclease/exonuclease/phosphatase family protein [Phycisphaera mikurensis]|uniref:Endonuclease/exonuclease/phosphatase domain-containing protein n=1 Tax=Phycisphaera mikurensis (strain NBRC 102666 / KCTC 22515 / FYK2301M01) TaxID=1142394 RepID=I0IGJ8_PHYMF|nr:endonuclease/exonuclease/phosphatase family protein [Phycisphaera mikurensis]MBB6442932.1 endonuclease/exonuclease/phosphatase family metal-dependent hydrolase [Phycisphaera mikurensis]BAM04386.1 hypothetical protein PSMK_22270 [Phycisphaera mikurensis NBRC 102666]
MTTRFLPKLLAFALALAAAGPAAAQPAEAGRLTVATYNIENAFDVFDDPYSGDEGTAVKSRHELRAIASAVAASNADLVFFQEVENAELLAAMAAEFLPDAGYTTCLVTPTNDGRGIHLGLLSRLPVVSVTSHRWASFPGPGGGEERLHFSRDAQEVVLDLPDGSPLRVFNVHLKSNRDREGDERSMRKRTAEALKVKRLAAERLAADPGALYLAVGDFNSDYTVAEGQAGPWPAMAALRRAEPDGSRVLLDVHEGLPREQRETLPGGGFYPPATFDYILASPAMARRLVPGSAGVIRRGDLVAGSDHLPVIATFRTD